VQDVLAQYLDDEARFIEAVKCGEDALQRGERMSKSASASSGSCSLIDVRWSMPAAEDLERICERIERDNSEAARRVARIIYERCATLKKFPELGRPTSSSSGHATGR